MRFDKVRLWFAADEDKALKASDFAIQDLDQIEGKSDADGMAVIFSVQDMLTVVEEHMNIAGTPYKVLRRQQEVEENLFEIDRRLKELDGQEDQYKLVVKNAQQRTELIIDEIQLAEEKTKARIDQPSS